MTTTDHNALTARESAQQNAFASGPTRDTELAWDGERFIPGMHSVIELEHLHRYRIACGLARGLNVLDIASGEGYGTSMLATIAQSAIGVDISENAVNHARAAYSRHNLTYRVGSAAKIPVDDNSIDLVVSFETIEHHTEHEAMMLEIKRVLKPGGMLLISSPNKHEHTDVLGIRNEFHVKELYVEEFVDLLRLHFPNIELYGQRVFTASTIAPVGFKASGFAHYVDKADNVEKPATDASTEAEGVARPIYFVALASTDPLPRLPVSVFESGTSTEPQNSTQGRLEIKAYWAGADRNYDETRAVSRFVESGSGMQTIDLPLRLLDGTISALRIDLGDRPEVIILHSLTIHSSADEMTWAWSGDLREIGTSHELHVRKLPGSGEALFITIGRDPWFELKVPTEALSELSDRSIVRVTVNLLSTGDAQLRLLEAVSQGTADAVRSIDGQLHKQTATLAKQGELIEQQATLLDKLTTLTERHVERERAYENTVQRLSETIVARDTALAQAHENARKLERAQPEAEARAASLSQQVEMLNNHIHALRHSTSWKLTSPIRAVGGSLHAVKNGTALFRRQVQSRGGLRAVYRELRAVLRNEGIAGVKLRLNRARAISAMPDALVTGDIYQKWIEQFDTIDNEKRSQLKLAVERLEHKPQISIVVPTYQTAEIYLRQMIESVQAQIYTNWELCIADDASPEPTVARVVNEYAATDARIKFMQRTTNGHISEASNSALELATGEYIALLDHDDTLPEHALYVVARYINAHPSGRLFYSDEDKLLPGNKRSSPYFKSDWNPELILAQNMFSHFGVYETELIRKVGGFRKGFEGSQDHDLILRCVEVAGHDAVVHIPHVLYHWRVIPGSTSSSLSEKPYALMASIAAVEGFLERTGNPGTVTQAVPGTNMLRVRYAMLGAQPKVSIVIPTRDRADILRQCIESVLEKTVYANYEVIVVDNGSIEQRTLDLFKEILIHKNVRVIRDERPFNFSALNNAAVKLATGEFVCLLNNDIEIISPDWLNELMSHAVRPGNGAIGAALWYPNETLQHGGVLVGIGDLAGHMHHLMPRGHFGYFGRAALAQNVTAVTAACLVVKKSIYEEVGGFDETLAVAFNDVDFCIKVREAGYRNVYTPFAQLYHHESATRGSDHQPETQTRFRREVEIMKERWGSLVERDPFYNPNLATNNGPLFSPAFPPRIEQFE